MSLQDQSTFPKNQLLARKPWLSVPPPVFRIFLRQNFFFIGACLVLLAIAYFFLFTGGISDTLMELNQYRNESRDDFFIVATQFAEPITYLIITALFCLFRYRSAIFAVLIGGIAGVISGVLKNIFNHARPLRYLYDNDIEAWGQLLRFDEAVYNNSWAYTSFPSGHAMSAFALYGFVAFNINKFKIPVAVLCFIFASLVALSRMYLLMHFLKDVTVGATLGLLIAAGSYYLQFKIFPDKSVLDKGLLIKK